MITNQIWSAVVLVSFVILSSSLPRNNEVNEIVTNTLSYEGLTNIEMFRRLLINMGIDPDARSVPSVFMPQRRELPFVAAKKYETKTFRGTKRNQDRHQVILRLSGGVLENSRKSARKSDRKLLAKWNGQEETKSRTTTTVAIPTIPTTTLSAREHKLRIRRLQLQVNKKRALEMHMAKQYRKVRKPAKKIFVNTSSTIRTTPVPTTTTTPKRDFTETTIGTTTDLYTFMLGSKRRKRSLDMWKYVNPRRYRTELAQRDEGNSLGESERTPVFQPSFSEFGNTIVVKSPKLPDMNLSFDVKNLTKNHDCVKIIFKPVVVNRKNSDPNANTSHRCKKETNVRVRRRKNGTKCTIITIKLKCKSVKYNT